MEFITIFLIVILVLAVVVLKKTIVIIPQSETKIIERLGKYYSTLQPGINIIVPFIDKAKEMVALARKVCVYFKYRPEGAGL